MIYLFTQETCIPCGMVKKYLEFNNNIKMEHIIEVPLESELAKRYGVTATPWLVVTNDLEEKLEEYKGGGPIVENIRTIYNTYVK